MTTLEITLYTRPGCHLCEEVAEQLADLQRAAAFTVRAVDITADFELHRRLWQHIPVVAVAGLELRAPIDPNRLAVAVLRAARGHTPTST